MKRLIAVVNRVLFERWDPIGISRDPEWPRDEYERDAPGVLGLVLRHATDAAVAAHLAGIEGGWLESGPTPYAHRLQVARAIREAVRVASAPDVVS